MYRIGMDILPSLKTGRVILALGPSTLLPVLLAELALRGPLTVLDGGNRFPAYRIAQEIRRRSVEIHNIADRLFLRRAFTAYQIVHLLESAPAVRHPLVLLDLLATFQDDQVQPREAGRLLSICLTHIHRLSLTAPVALYLDSHIADEKAFLLERLCERADEVFVSQAEPASYLSQLSLF